jgi:hypothetical protein
MWRFVLSLKSFSLISSFFQTTLYSFESVQCQVRRAKHQLRSQQARLFLSNDFEANLNLFIFSFMS